MLEKMFSDENSYYFDEDNVKKLNFLVIQLFCHNYNSVLNYFSYEVNIFNNTVWNKYIEHFDHTNYIITSFNNTLNKQIEYNKNQNKKIDPCSIKYD